MPDSRNPDHIKPSAPASAHDKTGAEAPVFGMHDFHEKQAAGRQQTKILWGIFLLLLVLVIGVIFVLPRYVSAPRPETQAPAVPIREVAVEQTQISPFGEAQLMRQREDAQAVLEDLLDRQEALEEISVQVWAGEDFTRALEIARQGDDAYNRQSFLEARDLYQRGRDILQQLQDSSSTVYQDALAAGEEALLDGNPALALESFDTAMLIEPASTEADTGYARAQVLDDVLALLEEGRALQEQGELNAARELYTQALAVDAEHIGAAEALRAVDADILERNFISYMSAGYASLQAGEPEQALASFQEARTLRSESAEANAAIEQAEDQITSRQLNVHLSAAAGFEQEERWQEAVQAYDKALAVDPNVVAAGQGRRYSQSRDNLDKYLKNILQNPLRLADQSVYDQTVTVYNDAINTEAPNSKLVDQLRQVRTYLEAATVPKPVAFQSDGLTHVSILRVSQLGLFDARTLELPPGNYVAVGVREGCRDVRKEFTVPFDEEAPVITVQCEEEIP